MPGASTNDSFKNGALGNTTGVDTPIQQLTVEVLTADPGAPELLATFPRVWINSTTAILKFCVDGTVVKSVTET